MSETTASTTATTYSELDEASRSRVDALRAARSVLGTHGLMSTVDALELVQVARFILSGRDPWADTGGAEQ